MSDLDNSGTSTATTNSGAAGSDQQQSRANQARQRAIDAFGSARDSVSDVRQRTADRLDETPFIAIAGGIAAGALIAALLPKTQAESKALRPVGKRITESAKTAAAAAKDAGTSRLAELGLTPERGSETLRSIFEGASDAVKTSAQAALGAARNKE
jgi:ElaB/YqjD/DUF883 family membrane-anchored ribosome-binding protein